MVRVVWMDHQEAGEVWQTKAEAAAQPAHRMVSVAYLLAITPETVVLCSTEGEDDTVGRPLVLVRSCVESMERLRPGRMIPV